MKPAKVNGGKVLVSNFSKGFKIDNVALEKQRKHYANHLQQTTKEIQFRDSKTAKSRKYAKYLNCVNPITAPKFSLDKATRRHYHVSYYLINFI